MARCATRSRFVVLLRAVNVGGTGSLPMAELRALAQASGFEAVRTYIQSGNMVLQSSWPEAKKVKATLEKALAAKLGKPVAVMVRTAGEMAQVLRSNPFPDKPGNQVMAVFLDAPPGRHALDGVVAPDGEELGLGRREIYVYYPNGMGRSKLKLPAASGGTARNINTVARLVEMAGD
jgi:uncharacterized protein (DUF1697 family)